MSFKDIVIRLFVVAAIVAGFKALFTRAPPAPQAAAPRPAKAPINNYRVDLMAWA